MCVGRSMGVFLQHWNLREGKISCFITANCITLILGIFRPLWAFFTNLWFSGHELDFNSYVSWSKHSLQSRSESLRPQEGVGDLCSHIRVLFSNWASFISAQSIHRHIPSLVSEQLHSRLLTRVPGNNFCWDVYSALAPILNQHLLPSYNTGTDLIPARPIVSHHLAWHLSVMLSQGMWYQADKKQHTALPGEPLCSSKPPLLLL